MTECYRRKKKAGELCLIHSIRVNDSLFLLFYIRTKIKGKTRMNRTKFRAKRAHSKHKY